VKREVKKRLIVAGGPWNSQGVSKVRVCERGKKCEKAVPGEVETAETWGRIGGPQVEHAGRNRRPVIAIAPERNAAEVRDGPW